MTCPITYQSYNHFVQGIKEVTLLGQNVNSYRDLSETTHSSSSVEPANHLAKGFKTIYKPKKGGRRFADLLEKVSEVDPEMRIRFTSPHPKDFPDPVSIQGTYHSFNRLPMSQDNLVLWGRDMQLCVSKLGHDWFK